MKRVKSRVLLTFTLIMIICGALLDIPVYGGTDMVLFNDTGSSPGYWENVINKVASASSLNNGPSSGNPGSFYYFRTSSGSREMSDAVIARTVALSADQRALCSLGQLQVNFSLDYFGWDDDDDRFIVSINSIKADGKWSTIFSSSSYTADKSWRSLNMPEKAIPADTVKIQAVITSFRESGSDLDVYLDNILLWVIDDNPPVMTEASVMEIRDYNNAVVTLKKDPETGEYLDNWVNPMDTIYGKIGFNEPVRVNYPEVTLNTNVLNEYGNRVYAKIDSPTWSFSTFSTSHQYSIPLGNKCLISGEGSIIKFADSIYPTGAGPFDIPVQDLGGNQGPSDIMKPNIQNYNIKFDNASPAIITPWDSYEEYATGRSSVDIVVKEEDMGREQSPLTLTYSWEYKDLGNSIVRGEEKNIVLNDTTALKVSDGTKTTYTVTIDIPSGSSIPPYQEFCLYAEVNDEARSPFSNRIFYGKVNQKDSTPPVITWDKSIHEDGTKVDLGTSEDTLYTTSRSISYSIEDQESGVEEVKYIWTREAYNSDSNSITKVVLPDEDGKYIIETTLEDTPMEGMYYLNILAVNGTDSSVVKRKGFYFDCEGPRVTFIEIKAIDGKPASAQYQVKDRALQNKFLYAFLTSDSENFEFEPIVEPDISEGIMDSGMWKTLELEGSGEERTAVINGVLDKITYSGYYKLVTRYYDEFYNCRENENKMWYDFEPPILEVMGSADLIEPFEPGIYKKEHSVQVRVYDEISGAKLYEEEISANWIDVDNGEMIPAAFEAFNLQSAGIIVRGNTDLNGKYYLKIKVEDYAENILEELLFMEGNPVEFCFDNSPPEVVLTCDTEKTAKTVMFGYSGLKDDYSGVSLFKYGISNTPEGEPATWIDIDPASDSGDIIYPEASITEDEWYLSILLQDASGNEQIIHHPSPFRIDATDPTGTAAFLGLYTNKPDVPLRLGVDELGSTERGTFKVIFSDSMDAVLNAQPTDWKDIIFENGAAYYNWTLSDKIDGEQSVFVRFMDEVGNLSEIYSDSIVLDRTAPIGVIAYDHDLMVPTNENVTATLTTGDVENTILNNNNSSTYIFNRNGDFEFIISDEAGNKTWVKTEVNNIDKDPPKATVTYSHPRDLWTKESITAALELADENGIVILGDGTSTHTFDESGEFLFQFRDNLGNEGSIKAEVKNIDKAPPVGSIIYTFSDTAPVTVYLSVYEPVQVTNNGGSFRRIFDDNGEFVFEFEDKAGNAGTAAAVVDFITSSNKYTDITYSGLTGLTKENVTAIFTPVSGLACITSPTVTEEIYSQYTYSFTENGEWPVYIRVLSGEAEGDIRTVAGSVHNIDRVAPDAEVILSATELTNQNVAVALLTYDDRGKTVTIKNNNGLNNYEFDENGTFTFELMDEAGNIGYKTVTVSNIDKTAPKGVVEYHKDTIKNIVSAKISFPEETEEVTILNNNGSDIFEFVENGTFEFEYSDVAGNKGKAAAQTTDFSDIISAGTIVYYIEEIKVADPNAKPTNKSMTAKLVLEVTGGPYTIVNNGGSDSYTFEQNGEFTFVYEDVKGSRGFATAKVSSIDKAAPKLEILADVVRPTQNDVTVTVSFSDNRGIAGVLHNMEAENVTAAEGRLTYVCKENKTIQVTVSDTAGNETTREFVVDYIDRKAPAGTVEYDPGSITNQDVKAVLKLDEPGRVLNNNGRMEYIFTENGEFTFEFEDNAGNRGSETAAVNWIDKLPPKGSLGYSSTEMSNKPIVVTLKTDPDAIIMNNGGMPSRTFYTNGYFTFRITDEAGNIVSLKSEVWNIDEEKPQITLKGNSYECIIQNGPYTEAGYRASDNIDGDITDKVAVLGSVNCEETGTYSISYKVSDAVGNIAEKIRTVRVIGHDELVLLINGKVTEVDMALLDTRNVTVSTLGNEWGYVIKYGEGKRTQAYFKGNGNIIAAGGNVWLEPGRWYTFFIQDRERRTKSIQIYINE